MKVHVRLFASMAQSAATRDLEVELPQQAALDDVKRALKARLPDLRWPDHVMWAINQEYVGRADEAKPELKDGDEVAIIPPVSGG